MGRREKLRDERSAGASCVQMVKWNEGDFAPAINGKAFEVKLLNMRFQSTRPCRPFTINLRFGTTNSLRLLTFDALPFIHSDAPHVCRGTCDAIGTMIDCPYVLPLPHCLFLYHFPILFAQRTNQRNINSDIWKLELSQNHKFNPEKKNEIPKPFLAAHRAHGEQ